MFKNIKLLKKLKRESTQIDYEFDNINARQEAVIDMKLNCVDDVVSPFCNGEDLILTQNFENYIENMASQIEPQNPILLRIDSKNKLSDECKLEIKHAIRNHYTKKISLENENLRRNTIDNIFLFTFSILLLSVLIAINLDGRFKIISEIIDIFAWVLLWEVFDSFVFQRRQIRNSAINNYRILNMRIEFFD